MALRASCEVSFLLDRLRQRVRRVDPHRGRQKRWLGSAPLEALRVKIEGARESGGACLEDGARLAVVHDLRREKADARVAVLGVVPREERAAVAEGIGERAEAIGVALAWVNDATIPWARARPT